MAIRTGNRYKFGLYFSNSATTAQKPLWAALNNGLAPSCSENRMESVQKLENQIRNVNRTEYGIIQLRRLEIGAIY